MPHTFDAIFCRNLVSAATQKKIRLLLNVSKCKECFHSILLHRRSNVRYEFQIDFHQNISETPERMMIKKNNLTEIQQQQESVKIWLMIMTVDRYAITAQWKILQGVGGHQIERPLHSLKLIIFAFWWKITLFCQYIHGIAMDLRSIKTSLTRHSPQFYLHF